jgi:hypothetical protein
MTTLVLCLFLAYPADMTGHPDQLSPADPDDLRQALAFALTFEGRKRFRHADELAARITAASHT